MLPSSSRELSVLPVLHVEDNAGDVRLIAEALQEAGIAVEVYVVTDGSDNHIDHAVGYRGGIPIARELLRHQAC